LKTKPKIIISGGGTGGHVFPAIAIADAIKEKRPAADILFVGARGKLEMEKVPNAGYPIEGLWISGFHRTLTWRNLTFPVKLVGSLLKSARLIRRFRPDAAVGVGGYASGPLLAAATRMGVPALLQEQNSFPGITNKLLAGRAQRICVAYEGMEQFFPPEKLLITGNPVRTQFLTRAVDRAQAMAHFGLDPAKKTIFLFGGSLGAQRLNEAVAAQTELLAAQPEVQLLWQVGKLYHERYQNSEVAQLANVRLLSFVDRMDLAYALADLVICRAGALTISELSLLGKAALLVPSPNVAEDHQTKNARALVDKGAAAMVLDKDAAQDLLPRGIGLLNEETERRKMAEKIKEMARPEAAKDIAAEVLALIK